MLTETHMCTDIFTYSYTLIYSYIYTDILVYIHVCACTGIYPLIHI